MAAGTFEEASPDCSSVRQEAPTGLSIGACCARHGSVATRKVERRDWAIVEDGVDVGGAALATEVAEAAVARVRRAATAIIRVEAGVAALPP